MKEEKDKKHKPPIPLSLAHKQMEFSQIPFETSFGADRRRENLLRFVMNELQDQVQEPQQSQGKLLVEGVGRVNDTDPMECFLWQQQNENGSFSRTLTGIPSNHQKQVIRFESRSGKKRMEKIFLKREYEEEGSGDIEEEGQQNMFNLSEPNVVTKKNFPLQFVLKRGKEKIRLYKVNINGKFW